jgi:hypothetical protein
MAYNLPLHCQMKRNNTTLGGHKSISESQLHESAVQVMRHMEQMKLTMKLM